MYHTLFYLHFIWYSRILAVSLKDGINSILFNLGCSYYSPSKRIKDMNQDRHRMQERITELREEMRDIILQHIPADGNITETKIQRCQIDLKKSKGELVALWTALAFLENPDQS